MGAPIRGRPFRFHQSAMMDHSFSGERWVLQVDPPLAGSVNMEVDRAMLDAVDRAPEPLTILRFYSWNRPTISLGRNQKIERAVDREYCRNHGIAIVHRPTGGRAVLHDRELTYAIASNDRDRFGGGAVYETYRRISMALRDGYRGIGIDALVAPDTARPDRGDLLDPPCFVSPSRYELMVGGRKVSGSAQRRLRHGFLQHGSLPLVFDHAMAAGAFGVDPAVLESEMAGMSEFMDLGPDIPRFLSMLTETLTGAFGSTFGVRFRCGDLSRQADRAPQSR